MGPLVAPRAVSTGSASLHLRAFSPSRDGLKRCGWSKATSVPCDLAQKPSATGREHFKVVWRYLRTLCQYLSRFRSFYFLRFVPRWQINTHPLAPRGILVCKVFLRIFSLYIDPALMATKPGLVSQARSHGVPIMGTPHAQVFPSVCNNRCSCQDLGCARDI